VDPFSLDGKVAFITGGNSGLGRASPSLAAVGNATPRYFKISVPSTPLVNSMSPTKNRSVAQ
jgi:hypothetical protein